MAACAAASLVSFFVRPGSRFGPNMIAIPSATGDSSPINFPCSRSFSGAPLEGNKIVRFSYMDEAGLSKPEEEPYLVVAGVIVNADSDLNGVERHSDQDVPTFVGIAHSLNWRTPASSI
jgi:hypothetical protein